jgi:hypothetical protein
MKLTDADKIMLYEKQYPEVLPAYKRLLLQGLIDGLPKELRLRAGRFTDGEVDAYNKAIAEVKAQIEEAMK